MKDKYDTIIVGAGIVGLLTALRLSQFGQTVLVVEKDKIGNGSTLSNHGMLHSGALYVRQHAHVVENLKAAQDAFSTLFSDAEIACKPSIYLSTKNEIDGFVNLLAKHKFKYQLEQISNIPELKSEMVKDYEAISLKERIFSSKKILELLASYCLGQRVDILLNTKISGIITRENKARGVKTAIGKHLRSDYVIIANGLGATHLLRTFSSQYCKLIQSRLDIMVYLPKTRISRGLIFSHLDKPILMPAKNGTALGSYHGGLQPKIEDERKFAVDFDKARLLVEMMNAYFNSEFVNTQQARFYMCGKTDYIGDKHTEQGFINPGHQVINHSQIDNIWGLQTIITGKMSLAFHASQQAAESILRREIELSIKPSKKKQIPKAMISIEPWADL